MSYPVGEVGVQRLRVFWGGKILDGKRKSVYDTVCNYCNHFVIF